MRIRSGGGIHHVNPGYALCDLTWFKQARPVTPNAEDQAVLRSTLDAIRALPADAELTELSKAVSKLLGGNRYTRQLALERLGCCGIPVNGWTGRDGVDDAAVAFWFPELA